MSSPSLISGACIDSPRPSTVSRKNFKSLDAFITEPDSRAQCIAVEENVKEFGLTYFGLTDRRQGVYRFPRMLFSFDQL